MIDLIRFCVEFDVEHPEIWDKFAAMAIGALQDGRMRYGANYIVEGIRWDTGTKVPAAMTAYYARKFMIEQDKLGFFETTKSEIDAWEPWTEYLFPAI
jgi:hypothetical protein